MAVCAWLLEKKEQAITMGLHLLPIWYSKDLPDSHLAEHEGVATEMDELHKRKIDLADEIFVVNRGYYIGESTRSEIDYAIEKGLPIRYYEDDNIGDEVKEILNAFLARVED